MTPTRDAMWIVAIVAVASAVITWEIVTRNFAVLTVKLEGLEFAVASQDLAIAELQRNYGLMRRDIYSEWMKGVRPKGSVTWR